MESSSVSWLKSGSAKAKLKVLSESFYVRDTISVAKDLLGKLLIVKSDSGMTVGRIVETEAYRGNDPASHSSRGPTPRCSVMFGDPGVAYVYFIYGMYEMLNFVTEPKGDPGAVLIRALEPVAGEELMIKRRGNPSKKVLTSGPGRLARAMGIRMSHNGQRLQGPSLFVADDGFKPGKIARSPRIGISQGTDKLWRFFIENNSYVSGRPRRKA